MAKNQRLREVMSYALVWLVVIAIIAGVVSFGIWFEIQRWHVYNYTHHTNISYWTWQFFVNSQNNH
jgi:Trk-type K+ transport system membrane component